MDKRTALRPGTSIFNRQPTRDIEDVRNRIREGIGEAQKSITVANDGTITFGRYAITPTGMDLPDDISFDEWCSVGKVVTNGFESSVSWAIGDWAEKANKLWQMTYEQIAEVIGYPVETLMTYASVCRSYPTSIRNRDVSFGHHRAVINREDREQILDRAAAEKWTVSQLQEMYPPPPKPKAKRSKRPAPSRVDTYGGLNFAKTAQKLGKSVNAIGQGRKLTDKRKAEILGYVQQIEAWLDALKQSTFEQDETHGD